MRRRPAPRLELGENRFVEALQALFPSRRGTTGIGDDAAILAGSPRRLLSTDLLVERQHFRWDLISPEDLAVRALEANLSDIAAMGGRPDGILLGLAWPGTRTSMERLSRLMLALRQECRDHGIDLLGGDTTRAEEGSCLIAITALGTPWRGGPVYRSGGKVGDLLVVTGSLGGSALGLALLEKRVRSGAQAARGAIERYRRPRARLQAAAAMARHATALIDLSDGLGLDAPRLARASGTGFEIRLAPLPLDGAFHRLEIERETALSMAIHGGEDYELLAAVPERRLSKLRDELGRARLPLSVIGRLTAPASGMVRLDATGRATPWVESGWDPFRPLDGARGRRVGQGARTRRR